MYNLEHWNTAILMSIFLWNDRYWNICHFLVLRSDINVSMFDLICFPFPFCLWSTLLYLVVKIVLKVFESFPIGYPRIKKWIWAIKTGIGANIVIYLCPKPYWPRKGHNSSFNTGPNYPKMHYLCKNDISGYYFIIYVVTSRLLYKSRPRKWYKGVLVIP